MFTALAFNPHSLAEFQAQPGKVGEECFVIGRSLPRRGKDPIENQKVLLPGVAPGEMRNRCYRSVAATLCVKVESKVGWQLDVNRNWMPRGD